MDSRQALAHIVERSGKSKAAISREMGRSANYISAQISMRRAPGVDVLAEIAAACGYTLLLRGHGEEIELGPAGAAPSQGRGVEEHQRGAASGASGEE